MTKPLWAPWRMDYILGPKSHDKACIFCGIAEASPEERRERLVVATTPRLFVVLNRYPFAAGHILIVPHAHVSSLEDLAPEDHDALFRAVREGCVRLKRALEPEGLNVGLNLGAAAGAGVAAHLHVHVVPRWSGDTNFMPALADTRVMPQALSATQAHLEKFFADLDGVEARP
jgi:ATP adenylyltransferase